MDQEGPALQRRRPRRRPPGARRVPRPVLKEHDMASTTEIIDVTPDQTLMPKLGKSGYSIPQAIAELLDNAIDARIEGELLHIAVTLKAGEFIVADDGMGMDREGITNSMILGRSSKRDMLGEFGLGLKTACTSLGKSFSVASSKLSQPFEYLSL